MHAYSGWDTPVYAAPEQRNGTWNPWKTPPGLSLVDEDIWRGVPIFYTAIDPSAGPPSATPPSYGTPMPEGPPPVPWRLIDGRDAAPTLNQLTCDTLGSKFFDDLLDGDDKSTSASSGEKETSTIGDMIGDKSVLGSDIRCNDDAHTLMIKNIPCRCSQQEVLDAISDVGFGDLYNFFYLPIRRGHEQNFGYAFVGFVDQEVTKQFSAAMTGYRFLKRNSSKACAIAPARIQGFSSNVEHFQKMRCTRRKNQSMLSMCV